MTDPAADPATQPEADPYARARDLAVAQGGFWADLPRHRLAYIPARAGAAPTRLVVSFDSLNAPKASGQRLPWGYSLLHRQGWDVLGVMADKGDFFRDDALFDALESLRDSGFFAAFPAVSMYGTSMGGYGAAAFAGLAPGCTVVAFAPQSSLYAPLVPFDRRYRYARRVFPWQGRYLDAGVGLAQAGRAYLFYDPFVPEDRAHIDRLMAAAPGAMALRCPLLSHKLPPAMLRMRILKDVSLAALDGSLTPAGFYAMLRARTTNTAHVLRVAQAAAARGHVALARRAVARQLEINPNWRLRRLRKQLGQA